MKKVIAIVLAVVLVAMLGATGVFAQENSNASAKATAKILELEVVSASAAEGDEVDWHSSDVEEILTQTIKTANDKDLFIDVSLLSGLYTETNVKSKGGNKDTSGAAGAVLVAVFVDGDMAFPGYPIVFEGRVQVLTATLGGYLVDDVLTPEEIGLIIGTLSANSFNFIVQDLDSGMHEVVVKAACVTGAFSQQGSAAAVAAIGLGSVTIEEVRMVKGEDAVPEF
jgi:hypothetical protein